MTRLQHFWKDNQVVSVDYWSIDKEGQANEYLELLCFDAAESWPEFVYGKFTNQRQGDWEHVPVNQFPPAFMMALLLLGIGE